MKRFSFLLVICFFGLGLIAQTNTLPGWAVELKNQEIVDSIIPFPEDPKGPNTSSFAVYYHQPLSHANPSGVQFELRAIVIVDKEKDPKTSVNHVYISGYNIMPSYVARPDSVFALKDNCATEIAHRYRATQIHLEHRYFDFSSPDECWTQLDYCKADEATEDFHNIIEAFKKVFKGKWVISGVSKGGITTLLQHSFHPEDADIFVPYSAPFFTTDRDSVMQHYWYNNGWSPEFLDLFMNIRKTGIANRETIFPIYIKKMFGDNCPDVLKNYFYGMYLSNIAEFGNTEHASSDTISIRKQMHANDSILNKMNMSINDTIYAYMLNVSFGLDNFPAWLADLRNKNTQQAPARNIPIRHYYPFVITEEQWKGQEAIPVTAYAYQAKCELGYFDCRFEELGKDEAEGKALNEYWKTHYDCYHNLIRPYFASCPFSRYLYDFAMNKTENATKPVILIYGLDDTWTGAAVKDEYINGTNVKKFILPAQNHSARFTSDTNPILCDEIRDILDDVLDTTTGIEDTDSRQWTIKSQKILRNGQIYFLRGDKIYTLQGQELK